ncbi:hypothetical protein H4F68_12200 [Rhodococcus globerulus]|nr:hypothetical protein [Rhodococcus globerulus]
MVRQCWKFIEQSVEQAHVDAIRARLYQRHDIHLSREPLEDAARVEPLYWCVPFREQSGAAHMQVETTALPGSVAVALPHQLLGIGYRQQHCISESATALQEHLPDGGEFALESSARSLATPAEI